jgi:hypothetical protein
LLVDYHKEEGIVVVEDRGRKLAVVKISGLRLIRRSPKERNNTRLSWRHRKPKTQSDENKKDSQCENPEQSGKVGCISARRKGSFLSGEAVLGAAVEGRFKNGRRNGRAGMASGWTYLDKKRCRLESQ